MIRKTSRLFSETIDLMVDMLRYKEAAFYNQYQAARVIKDYGSHWSRNGNNGTGKTETETVPETATEQ